MRIVILLVLSLLSCFISLAQNYGNEWISYDQKHFSFPILESGIHKIEYAAMVNAGIPLGSISSANLQIFGKEKEIPIYIEDGGDAVIDNGDYVLFYAEANDGWLDSTLYDEEEWIGNPKYSLYNDTLQYFLTWNSEVSNFRFTIESAIDFENFDAEDFVIEERFNYYSNSYNEGEKSSDASSSFYMPGEGWGSSPKNGNNGYTWDFGDLNFDGIFQGPSAPAINYESVVVGRSNAVQINPGSGNHHTRHTIGVSDFVLVDSVFSGYKSVFINGQFPASIISPNGSSDFKVNIIGDLGVATDYQSINYWSFKYPRTLLFSNESRLDFEVFNSTNLKSKIELEGGVFTNPIAFIVGSESYKLTLVNDNGLIKFLVPNSTQLDRQKIVIQSSSSIQDISALRPVNQNGFFTEYASTPNIESMLLFVYNKQLELVANEYAAHRSSTDGGMYNVVMAEVEELYQQYGGGIPKHINGIRRFAHHMYELSTEKPVGLFLIGKGVREANITSITSIGPGSRTSASAYQNSLVPSFGQPSCDACITSNFIGTDKWTPLIPTGRISAKTPADLQIYLSKIIAYDAQQNPNDPYSTSTKDWQKHILHFSGGGSFQEQQSFQIYLNGMADKAEDYYFGGDVELVAKENDNPISPSELQDIKDRISQGVSIMNFFGHFSTTESGFDINLDNPLNWENQDKYPVLIANSCYNGNIFHNATSNSESFVLTPDAGVIAYLGTLNYGFTGALNSYSNHFYEAFSRTNYGGTIGEHIQATIDSVMDENSSLIYESTFMQMTLHGDPMIKINSHELPELELTDSRISFGPDDISLATDSIELTIKIRNLGKAIVDTFDLTVNRNFPGSLIDSNYVYNIPGLNYETILNIKLPFQASQGIGINTFNVKVDRPDFVEEQYDELVNNQVVKNFLINVDGLEPVWPENFAVLPIDSVTVKASTIDALAPFNTYRFELDTTPEFNSPFAKVISKSASGGVLEVHPSEWSLKSSGISSTLVLEDSIVYFWRTALDDTDLIWKQRSFQFIPNKRGWGQDVYGQFISNSFNGVELSSTNFYREFTPIEADISCLCKSTTSSPGHYDNAWYLNSVIQDYNICTLTPKFHVAVIDKSTLQAWGTRYVNSNGTVTNPNNNFGNNNDNGGCNDRVMKYFTFNQNSAVEIDAFQNFVENEIPDGDYILIYTPMTTRYDLWDNIDPDLYTTFMGLGSDSIAPGRANRPFIFLTRKGDPNFVLEIFSQNNEDIFLDTLITGAEVIGFESSPVIGPVQQWNELHWKQDPLESNSDDTTFLEIQLLDALGNYQSSIDTLFTQHDSILNLQTLIDGGVYPKIKLIGKYQDLTNQTPAQVDFWHVLYSPIPEAAIASNGVFLWEPSDTIQEGRIGQFSVDVVNISDVAMDSLLIAYFILDANQEKHYIPYERQDSLRVSGVLKDTVSFDTKGLVGSNFFCMEVNPYINASLTLTDQLEWSHLNNILQYPFSVIEEDINPILDVTFNGIHILNKDIIAPTTEINISLNDENPYLLLDSDIDTSLFGIYITDPDGLTSRIPFMDGSGNMVMNWIPGNENQNKFKISYPAYFEKSGVYLLLVQGSDKTGNESGDFEYEISFEVIHKSMITQLLNYPNPFSTSTRFVFTLTGDLIPDEVFIQIMTISGRVVREISESEIGPIQIGRNITEFAWDGRDQFGDLLANGVYLYRVKAQINGKDIDLLNSGADQYFHKGLGKMYIIR
tara:strand:+ start:7423 stop:12588 length:5166 start_codon:yes stop_codon:yes gene_type:complete